MTARIQYRCRACPLEFTDAATSNAHHDATGHHQTFRCWTCHAPLSGHTESAYDYCFARKPASPSSSPSSPETPPVPHCHECRVVHSGYYVPHLDCVCKCGATKPNLLGSDRWTESSAAASSPGASSEEAARLAVEQPPQEFVPAEAFHPSVTIREEMDARDWTLRELCQRMGGDYVTQRCGMEMYLYCGESTGIRLGDDGARDLERAFGISAEFWTTTEATWRRWKDNQASAPSLSSQTGSAEQKRESWTYPKGPFPGVLDHDREAIAGQTIRRAVDHDPDKMRFYLTCSVGELAQRVVVALAALRSSGADTPKAKPNNDLRTARESLHRIFIFLDDIANDRPSDNGPQLEAANVLAEYEIVKDRIERLAGRDAAD